MYYKQNTDNSITTANKVFGPDFQLDETTTDVEADGWKWFDDPETAYEYFANLGKPTSQTITALHSVFSTAIPPEVQASFAIPYAIVRVLVEAEQNHLAREVIRGVEVPPELDGLKESLISLI